MTKRRAFESSPPVDRDRDLQRFEVIDERRIAGLDFPIPVVRSSVLQTITTVAEQLGILASVAEKYGQVPPLIIKKVPEAPALLQHLPILRDVGKLIKILSGETYMITEPVLAARVLAQRKVDLGRLAVEGFGNNVAPEGTPGTLFTPNFDERGAPQHVLTARPVTGALMSNRTLKAVDEICDQRLPELVRKLEDSFNVYDAFGALIGEISGEVLCGERLKAEDVTALLTFTELNLTVSFLSDTKFATLFKYVKGYPKLRQLAMQIIDRELQKKLARFRSGQLTEANDIIDALIISHHRPDVMAVLTQGRALAEGDETQRYLEKTIRDAISTLIFAMYDTTKNASAALLLEFTQKPELFTLVHQEVTDYEQRKGQPLGLEGLVDEREVIRFKKAIVASLTALPPTPMIAREIKETIEFEYRGKPVRLEVPAGQTIPVTFSLITMARGLEKDRQSMNIDWDRFTPDSSELGLKQMIHIYPFNVMPDLEKEMERRCSGRALAIVIMAKLLTCLVKKYQTMTVVSAGRIGPTATLGFPGFVVAGTPRARS